MTKPFREESRKSYWCGDNDSATLEQINTGSLQRIADATEKMCLDREKLERDYKHMRANRDQWRAQCEQLIRQRASLRGVVTRLKHQVTELKGHNDGS